MSNLKTKWLVWAPRILGLLLAGFLGMFALDAFDGEHGAGGAVLAFGVHLVPAAIVLASVALAWRRPLVGTGLFTGMGAWYAVRVYADHPRWILPIAVPALVIGALFAVSWWIDRRTIPPAR